MDYALANKFKQLILLNIIKYQLLNYYYQSKNETIIETYD